MTNSKQAYIKEMEEELKKWELLLEEFTEKVSTAVSNKKLDLQSALDKMTTKKMFLEQVLKDLKKSDSGWEQLKQSIDGTASNLDNDYRSALAYTVN